ncbi:MAG: hypothetical protein M1820_000635 [Bogoriella megaspora]|nr:MAG: hypothetical protein M1820_000635 [Bogoriella megaspora]
MAYKRPRSAFEADLQAQESPYVYFGTPLPPLDSGVRDDGSYVPIWKQEVTDERGRKRLHGAFTGGFHAGYFDTVGSKEGWAPSTFQSSRTNRHKDSGKTSQQRAEEYMDEEDLADAAEAQKLQTQDSFSGLGGTENDGKRDAGFMDLFRPSGETMGTKLLQRMGWRPGQGIGPKVRRAARLGDNAESAENGDATHMFAPEDSPMISFIRKDDHKGLGYAGEARIAAPQMELEDDEDDSEILSKSRAKIRSKKDNRRSGLGVGILNDTGSDDEDPYEMGPKMAFNKTIGGDKKNKTKLNGRPSIGANPRFRARAVFTPKGNTLVKGFRKCHDGRLPLDGFLLSTIPLSEPANKYKPPKVPPDWKPAKQNVAIPSDPTSYQSTSDAAKASTLDPKSRAAVLGETPLPGKSVFDFLSPDARARLVNITGNNNLPRAGNEAPPTAHSTPSSTISHDSIPHLDKDTATAALRRGTNGWTPYIEDPEKRARYRAFIEYRAGLNDDLRSLKRAQGHMQQDWIRELAEFANAARVFKPVSGIMASRFTSSSLGPKIASDRPDSVKGTEESSDGLKAEEKQKDPKEEAARLGMWGPMTRYEFPFYPTRLLCKRFGVPPPPNVDPGNTSTATSRNDPRGRDEDLDILGKEKLDEMMRDAAMRPDRLKRDEADSGDAGVKTPTLERAVVDVEKNEALEGERAGEALFKAIFGSDDEDD